MSQAEFDQLTRGTNYAKANNDFPSARFNEVKQLLRCCGDITGNVVVELGLGNGYVTRCLLNEVGLFGKVHSFDNSQKMLDEVGGKINNPNLSLHLQDLQNLPIESNTDDLVVSLANFHHLRDKQLDVNEYSRILKPGGKLVIGDIADKTPTARYFDEYVDKVCSTGHKYEYLDRNKVAHMSRSANLELVSWDIHQVPWQFRNKFEAKDFLHTIHDAGNRATPDECLIGATSYLGLTNNELGIAIGWQLGYWVARKA